jgi:hypothetical protein
MTNPNIVLNPAAIGAAVLAAYIFGGIWYGPLFGKKWAKIMGMNPDQKPDPKVLKRAYLFQLVGCVLTAYVMTHVVQVWRPSAWGYEGDGPSCIYGFFAAFYTCLGFYVPLQLTKIGWENRHWKLFFINIGHDFFNLLIVAEILSYWR